MDHEYYMKIVLDLARSVEWQTSPSRLVGAVCVKDGQIIGTGAHLRAGTPLANSADFYVTLESCTHTGATPPCTEHVILSGFHRVFVAIIDQNPSVNGTGIELLENAGIDVVTGILEKEAEQLNRAFFYFIKYGIPYVTLNATSTLDGRLSTQTGDSKWITSDSSRTDVHHLCHSHDAILAGVQTVLHDNPFLTTRLPHGGKNPIRIISRPASLGRQNS